jgi:hypothetical protein
MPAIAKATAGIRANALKFIHIPPNYGFLPLFFRALWRSLLIFLSKFLRLRRYQ